MKLTVVAAAACAAGAAAFTPAPFMGKQMAAPQRAASLRMEVGADVEMGGKWDPLGLSEMYKRNNLGINPHPQFLAEAEVKHCRLAMLAVVGTVVVHNGIHLPGMGYESDWYNAVPELAEKNPLALAQILVGMGIWEGYFGTEAMAMWTGEGTRGAGEFGQDYLNILKGKTQAEKDTMALKEIKNGRLAMIAMLSFWCEHWIPGSVPALGPLGY